MVLACVVLIDLASYKTVVLRASGAQLMNPSVEKIVTCVMIGSATLVQWDEGRVGVIGTFIFVESDVFIRFNLRRPV